MLIYYIYEYINCSIYIFIDFNLSMRARMCLICEKVKNEVSVHLRNGCAVETVDIIIMRKHIRTS